MAATQQQRQPIPWQNLHLAERRVLTYRFFRGAQTISSDQSSTENHTIDVLEQLAISTGTKYEVFSNYRASSIPV